MSRSPYDLMENRPLGNCNKISDSVKQSSNRNSLRWLATERKEKSDKMEPSV